MIFTSILGPKRLQKEAKKFQKIIKILLFVARWSFWHPLADFGLHFCSPRCPFWLHYGRWGCCFRFTLLDRAYFWPSVLVVTAIYAPLQSRRAQKCANLLIFNKILDFPNRILPKKCSKRYGALLPRIHGPTKGSAGFAKRKQL